MSDIDPTKAWSVIGNTLYLGTPGRAYVAFPGDASGAHAVADAYNALLTRCGQVEAQAALYRGTIDSAAKLLRARPIKTAFDDDVIRMLTNTLAERDAGRLLLAELVAAQAVVEVARRILSKRLDASALWSVVRDYDAVKVGQEP